MHSPALAITRTPLVAVYGTLKQGLRNHHWLEGATFVGRDHLTTATLYDLGRYPGAKAEPSRGVEVEVYRVDAQILADLDRLEDYRVRAPASGMYDRAIHDTAFGPAWLYLYNPDVTGHPAIHEGAWQPAG
ncbi:gamma-glutamylcyclotransferase family protein [Halomonas elongata]|uniref:Gamma-glutamylcyclotransferase family protein n=1 Tax=Halomonas elongata TaxID=2746 RepID=A0A1B8NUS0_HALEL|nr:gamma-glutamylcyclotransferase family protein [Halomonas elongata]MDL4864442.1 gamma-glutamylcyclotransferase family protein [Halomonas elongata]OBX33750.1 gamma-glutamylcyclotransferase family protein ytfP [Halomonas elongata]RAW08033.1 gamma-glutamylcyclotransferase [Halomonas elongata]WVI70464.1 gamma-glutamylcyclotransferase family protein [Halomonas elongata]